MQIYEAEGKTAVIAFGRMNPPTIGHAKLADKIASLPGDPYIFLSHSQKPKTDPLSFEQKAGYAKAFFPNVTVGDPEVRTAIQAFSKISDMGYSNLIYVAGSDRVDDFQKLLSTYNGQPDKEGNVAYNFDNIKVVSAGARDPDAEGAEGMSASKMRAAAASGDFESFKSGTPDPKLAQAMYRDVRNGLGMMESLARIIEVATMLKSLDEVKPITEDVKKAFGVVVEAWSEKYKRSINCNNPKGFSQRAHCAGRKKNENVAEGLEKITEYRDRMYQYLKSIVPGFPDYVVKDWLYANFARGATQGPGWSFDTIGKDIPNLLKDMGLSVDTKWQLVPNMKFTMDMWEPKTLKRLQARAGGNSKTTDPDVHIPARDAERHATQAKLAQQQGGVRKEPVILIKTAQGYELLEGWHRTIQHFAMYPQGYTGPAYVAVAQGQQGVNEDATSSDLSSVYTPSIPEIAKKHNISLQQVVDQLKKGLTKESEHTKNFDVALEIAMDHVAEIPDYYDRIEDIEGPYVEPDPKGYQIAGESQLNERATDIVYHYTTIGPALNILKSGEFQLSSVAGSVEQDINPKGHNFFLSTARSKGGEYHSRVGDSAVMFVLNGRWFSDRYPVKPVDYWAGFSIAGRNKEAEDRIFSKDPTMPIDPVTSIHVLLKEQNPFASAKTRQFLIRAKTLGIPTYLYKDESAWRLQNTAKAVSVAQMKSELSGPETFRTGGSGSRWLLPWLEVIFGKTDADLGKKAKDLVRGFRYYHNPGDDHGLGNELSNARKPGNLDREDAVKILKFMRQNRMLTHKDLVNYLVDKWKVKDESINEAGVGRITKQNATKDAPIGSEFANVKKLGLGSGKPKELHAKARKNSDPNTLFNLGLAESKELNENQVSISQDVDGGSLEGYVVDTNMPNLSNYLSSQGADPTLAEKISQQFGRIGVIRNMYVDDDRRGEGIGSELMSNAIDSAYDNDAEAIILVADTGESNEFDLVNWYNNYGFEKIGDASGDPIMLLAETKLQERGSISVPFASGTSVTIAPHRPLKVRKSKKKVKMVGAGGEE